MKNSLLRASVSIDKRPKNVDRLGLKVIVLPKERSNRNKYLTRKQTVEIKTQTDVNKGLNNINGNNTVNSKSNPIVHNIKPGRSPGLSSPYQLIRQIN